jgi:hypothetical protein
MSSAVRYGTRLGDLKLENKQSTHTLNNTQCSEGFKSCSAVGRPLGRRWILEAGLRVGGPGTPPFWRTRDEFCTVWNSAR